MTAEEELALDIARDLIWKYDYMCIYEEAYESGLDADRIADALKRVDTLVHLTLTVYTGHHMDRANVNNLRWGHSPTSSSQLIASSVSPTISHTVLRSPPKHFSR